mgnify:CR=1 FL=1
MKKQSEFDLAVDILLDRQKGATSELIRRFKNTRPFRQVPIPRKEMLLDYEDLMSREAQVRQEHGDDVVDKYKANMSKFVGGK